MAFVARFFPDLIRTPRRERLRLLAMSGAFFLAVCALGVLRPIKNSLALDGLGATDFYKVYLVSAGVVLFAPLYNFIADRFSWRTAIPALAVFFAANLVCFRLAYVEGSPTFGMLLYGWYDLFAAALVTQFFMATQLFFNARSAKQAYPLIIGGGALGATTGGMITGLLAQRLGTPDLLLVAAALICAFAVSVPFVYSNPGKDLGVRRVDTTAGAATFHDLWQNRHLRFIAATVLLAVVVKQLVDYQFNTLTMEAFQTRDAITAFQGKFNALTQWLPLVVVVILHPLLLRWGIGVAILLMPVALLLTSTGLAVFWGLFAAAAAKGAETSLRYSAERAGRELLYLPVPEELRLRAKAYIDVGLEKGLAKAAGAALIALVLQYMGYRGVAYLSIGLSALWLLLAVRLKREYVRTLARAIEGRFVSLRGVFASILDANTLPRVRAALCSPDPLQVAFALDLVDQASPSEVKSLAPEINQLLKHGSESVRERALLLLTRTPEALDSEAAAGALGDEASAIREAAVRALATAAPDPEALLRTLLTDGRAPVRAAVLAQLPQLPLTAAARQRIAESYLASEWRQQLANGTLQVETALAAAALGGDNWRVLVPLLQNPDSAVVNASLRAAGALRARELLPGCVRALGRRETREAARAALAQYGQDALPALTTCLLDAATPASIRRSIPAVMARIPSEFTAAALLRAIGARETDQTLDFRALKALGKMRAQHRQLRFEPALVNAILRREVQTAHRYVRARALVRSLTPEARLAALVERTLTDAWRERRECAFRCLGLLHSPEGVLNAYTALESGDARAGGNALEWLEQEIGYEALRAIQPVVMAVHTSQGDQDSPIAVFTELQSDEDAWIASCARALLPAPALVPAGGEGYDVDFTQPEDHTMELIERVFLLQGVDLLQGARSAHLALLASIAEQTDVTPGTVLLEKGRPVPALYVVVRGQIELLGPADQPIIIEAGGAFGTWALIDDEASVIAARALETTRLLRINRSDFFDLLAEYPELALGLLQGLARRVRTLVA